MQEGETNSIDMKVDDPDAVAALLDFLYLRDYKIPAPAPKHNHWATSSEEYDGEASSDELSSKNPILFHLKVYALAERILYQPLKALVEKKFEAAAAENWNSPEFPPAIKYVYDVAPPGARGDYIRGIAVNLAAKYARDLFTGDNGKQFSEMMEKNAEFGKDLAIKLSNWSSITASGRRGFSCPTCAFTFIAALPKGHSNYVHCPLCGDSYVLSVWLRYGGG
jgi:hypothetical protein